ncbi:MAG: hypothetical protein IAG10_35310 [Planctomycetaceae bacterium]|nr:hypothetical protein [Planctomycetaceae bacterium]
MLEDKVPEHLKMSAATTGLVLGLGLLFVVLNIRPLWHTDLWGHLSYGRWIAAAKAVPAAEPLMPLAKGVPFIDTAWLSQVIGFTAIDRLGVTSLTFLYAASITAMAGLLLWRGYHRSQSAGIALAGVGLWLWACWQHLSIMRPQLAGMLCFTLLLTLVTSRHRRTWHWLAVPVLFVAWANLHGSFIVGLLLLAGLAAGRAIDLAVRCGEFRAIRRDSHVRRYVMLLELAAAAVLLNPYGLRLYAEILSVASNPNVAELVEWSPLQLRMVQGQATAVITLLLIVLYRMSPRRVTSAEVLLLFGFGAAALWTSRMLVWWVPLAVTFGMQHASAIWHTKFAPLEGRVPAVRNGRWSVITVGLVWICFAFTPFGSRMLHGDDGKLKLERLVSSQTPVAITEHLKKLEEQNRLPRGQAFNTYEWGDYLLWAGPPKLKVFLGSHVHLVPREVWNDYVAISDVASGWEEMLDRYGVNLIAVDSATHAGLITRLRENENWRQTYSDNVGAVFTRRKAI